MEPSTCETWKTFVPVNSTSYSPGQIVRFRIAKDMFVSDFSRAFISLRFNIPMSLGTAVSDNTTYYMTPYTTTTSTNGVWDYLNDGGDFTGSTGAGGRAGVLGLMNTANVFDIVELRTNGVPLFHNDFVQTTSRLKMLNASEEWLRIWNQTFLPPVLQASDVTTYNSPLLFRQLDFPANTAANQPVVFQKELIIPLNYLFDCLDYANDWPTFLQNDSLEIDLYMSRAYKYLVDVVLGTKTGHFTPRPIPMDQSVPYALFTSSNSYISSNVSNFLYVDQNNITLDNITLYVPGHVPSAEEYNSISNLVSSGIGLTYTFRHWDIVSALTRYANDPATQYTHQQTFPVTTPNIFGVATLALRPSTEVIFEKPQISTIQVNLGPWELASNGTHIGDNYTYGADMWNSVLSNFGQSELPFYQTINDGVMIDQSLPLTSATPTNRKGYNYRPTGNYLTYWDASPHDEVGVGASEFGGNVIYRYSITPFSEADGAAAGTFPIPNQVLLNGKTYCCLQTLSGIHIGASGITLERPSGKEMTVDFLRKIASESGVYVYMGPHGLPLAAVPLITTVLPKVIKFVPGLVKNTIINPIRNHLINKHMNFFMKNLTQDELQTYYAQLYEDAPKLFPSSWKRTYNEILRQRQLNAPASGEHGLFMQHGLYDRHGIMPSFRLAKGDFLERFQKSGHMPVYACRSKHTPFTNRFDPSMPHGLMSSHGAVSEFFRGLWNKTKDRIAPYISNFIGGGAAIIQGLISGNLSGPEAIAAAGKLARQGGEDIREKVKALVAQAPNRISSGGVSRLLFNLYGAHGFKARNFAKPVGMRLDMPDLLAKRAPA